MNDVVDDFEHDVDLEYEYDDLLHMHYNRIDDIRVLYDQLLHICVIITLGYSL